VEKYDGANEATNEGTTWRMNLLCWITKAIDKRSECAIVIVFPRTLPVLSWLSSFLPGIYRDSYWH
jgi:hypothetical protein